MEKQEFKRVLALVPVVRSRDFHADQDSSGQSTSGSLHDDAVQEWHDDWDNGDKNEQNNEGKDRNDAFWEKLKLAVESKVGNTEAEKFCWGFQQAHRRLVYEVFECRCCQEIHHLLQWCSRIISACIFCSGHGPSSSYLGCSTPSCQVITFSFHTKIRPFGHFTLSVVNDIMIYFTCDVETGNFVSKVMLLVGTMVGVIGTKTHHRNFRTRCRCNSLASTTIHSDGFSMPKYPFT